MIEIPEQFRSRTPARLRELAGKSGSPSKLRPTVQRALLEASAEIEGSEEAYAVLVSEVQALRKELAKSRANHQHTLQFLDRWRDLLVALLAENPGDVRLQRALAGEHPMRAAQRDSHP